jgi:hypothetical protein
MTRRKVLVAISQLATAATLASCDRSAGQAAIVEANPDLEVLASVVYDILPYSELPPAVYVSAARQILDLKDSEVTAGLMKLREASNGAWKNLQETQRVAILTSLQDSPFFAVVRAKSLQVLLRDPATYAVIGYGGSSIQYGGYLGRGFNDISWLPASTTK